MTPDAPLPPPAPAAPPRRGDLVLAFLAALVLLASFAGARDLWDADEGRYASVALDMARAGDLVTPRENGLRFLDKPPLLYWAEIASSGVLGPTPFAARLPCVVAGAALAAFAFLFAAAWTGSRRTAFLAALLLATSGGGMGLSRTVTMDMPLAACVAGALYAGWCALARDGWRPRAGLGLALGLGLLAKGPLALVATAVVAASWGLVGASWPRLLRVGVSPLAWTVALLVAAPWYVACEHANPGYLWHFLEYEHFRRFREAGIRDFSPVWIYAATLPLFLVPWTHLLVRARLPASIEAGCRKPVRAERFAWAWVLSLLVFYSAGRNRLYTYVLPAFLPLAVLAAARLSDRLWSPDPRVARGPARAAAAYGALALGAGLCLHLRVPFVLGRRFGSVLLPTPATEVCVAAAGLPIAVGSLYLVGAPLLFRAFPRPAARAARLVLGAALLFAGLDVGARQLDDLRSSKRLAGVLVRATGQGTRLVCLDCLPQGLRFYAPLFVEVAGKQLEIVEPWAGRDGKGILHTEAELQALWASRTRVVLIAREKKAQPWLAKGGRVLASGLAGDRRSDLVVLENRALEPPGR